MGLSYWITSGADAPERGKESGEFPEDAGRYDGSAPGEIGVAWIGYVTATAVQNESALFLRDAGGNTAARTIRTYTSPETRPVALGNLCDQFGVRCVRRMHKKVCASRVWERDRDAASGSAIAVRLPAIRGPHSCPFYEMFLERNRVLRIGVGTGIPADIVLNDQLPI